MLQKELLIFVLCLLQFQYHHSRYVLIDLHDEGNGLRDIGCGGLCFNDGNCNKVPRVCPHCEYILFFGICVPPP